MGTPAETIIEHCSSRQITGGANPSVRLIIRIMRLLEEGRVIELLLNPELGGAPLTAYGLPRHQFTLDHKGGGLWYCTVDYSLKAGRSGGSAPKQPSGSDPVPPEVSFDFAGQNEHVTQALQDVSSVKNNADPNNVPAVNRAIGWNMQTGEVAGVDLPMPSGTFSEIWTQDSRFVTYQYLANVRDLIGRTNNASFRSFAAGEVMFLGCNSPGVMSFPGQLFSGQLVPGSFGAFGSMGTRKVTFNFRVNKNRTFTPAPGFNQITVGGFQYWWGAYAPAADNGNGCMISKPKYFYVQDVGRPDESGNNTNQRDFSVLGIG